MNKVIIMGRLTKDPDINENRAAFNVAVDRKYKKDGEKQADFPRCVAFGKTKEFIEKYLANGKGVKLLIEGSIRTGSYKSAMDGHDVYTTDVVVDSIEFAESKKTAEPQTDNGFADADDEALPFA